MGAGSEGENGNLGTRTSGDTPVRIVRHGFLKGKHMSQVGSTFVTGNSTVATLPVGTTLKVVGPGQVEIVSVPEITSLADGQRIQSKYGPATVVRLTSRVAAPSISGQGGIAFYIADDTTVVRVARKGEFSLL